VTAPIASATGVEQREDASAPSSPGRVLEPTDPHDFSTDPAPSAH